jgi:hypothetical protein
LELFFNREFLIGVLPLGMAGVSLSVTKVFYMLYLIGGVSFGLIFFLQFAIMFLALLEKGLSRTVRSLVASVMSITAVFDIAHVAYGLDNTAFNQPIASSLVYVVLIVSTALLAVKDVNRKVLYAVLVPDVVAYLLLIGPWLTQMTLNSAFGTITVAASRILPFSILFAGIAFTSLAVGKVRYVYPLAGLLVSVPIALIAWFNAVPGIAFMLGFTFPYILGIMGINDYFPPIFFVVACVTMATAIGLMRRKDKAVAVPALALLGSALIFDTVPSTTYLLFPLIAVLLSAFYS